MKVWTVSNLETTLGQRLKNLNNNVAFLMLLGTAVNAQPLSIFLKFKFCCIQCSQSKQTGVLALKSLVPDKNVDRECLPLPYYYNRAATPVTGPCARLA